MEITQFYEKLNKVYGKVYVIEEKIRMPESGIYEAELQHDNINDATIAVYTGQRLTGEQVLDYVLSTPSLAPWKRVIRIQSASPAVYSSYETEGDTVEADDINSVQDAVVATQDAVNVEESRAKAVEANLDKNLLRETERAHTAESSLSTRVDNHAADVAGEIQALKAADIDLDGKKADTSDVNRELSDRYTKSQVYTKEEVLLKIEELIGTAPDTLDTFKEIADALGNNPDFAATIIGRLSDKVDKVPGKQLTSNDYSDSEKLIVADVNTKKHEHINKSVIDKLTQPLLDNLSAAFKHITDAIKHIPSGGTNGQVLKRDTDGNAVWGNPETGYNHPVSGVTPGTYCKVTVDVQGHVISGSSPTTLSGYGITDAAASGHMHDGTYLKKTGLTWAALKGGN